MDTEKTPIGAWESSPAPDGSALDYLTWATSDFSPLAEAASIAFDKTHSTAALVCWLKCR